VNQKYYLEVPDHLRKRVMGVRVEIADEWIHHDNAPAHTALSVREYLAKKCIPVLPEAPYSPDLSLSDLYLFQK
jgi:hypothetical protein